MTVEEVVELVYLKVTGGSPSTDDSVLRSDIRFYVPDGVNSVMMEHYAAEQQMFPTGYPNQLFIQVFPNVQPVMNSSRGLYEVKLPKRALTIPLAQSVTSIGIPGGYQFDRFYPEDGTLGSYLRQMDGESPSFSVEGDSAVLYNAKDQLNTVIVKQVVHIDDYDTDQDSIIVPSGMETVLIQNIYDMVMGQRSNPRNAIVSGKDDGQ